MLPQKLPRYMLTKQLSDFFSISRYLSAMTKRGRSASVVMTPEARVLRSLREKKGWSMRKLAQELGYSDSYVSQIENGRENPPRGDKLSRFLAIYDISPKYFG